MKSDLEAVSLTGELDAFLASRSWRLPVCAEPARRILERLGTAPDRTRLIEVALSDPTLLTSLLREANSLRFDGLEATSDVDRALSRVGEERAEELLRETLTEARFEGDSQVLAEALSQSRCRALGVARSAAAVARATGHPELSLEAERLGLLSELGTVFLVTALQARIDDYSAPLTDFATLEMLAQLQQGYRNRLLELWRFPRRTVEILSERSSGAEERRLMGVLELGRQVVASAGLPAVGTIRSEQADTELFELAESFELSNVELAALQVRAEDVVSALRSSATAPQA